MHGRPETLGHVTVFILLVSDDFPPTTQPASRADGASTGACGRFGLEILTCMGLEPARKLRRNR